MRRQPKVGVTLDLTNLSEGLNHRPLQVEAAALELEWPGVEFQPTVDLELVVLRMGDNVQVDGEYRSTMRAACDRCLEIFERRLAGSFRVIGRRGDAQTHELAGQDGVVLHQGQALDLTRELREAILLEVPMQNLCSPDCRGLCPQCGADRNQGDCGCGPDPVDVRWAALSRLKDQQAG